MGELDRRLTKLEQQIAEVLGQCGQCADRPAYAVLYPPGARHAPPPADTRPCPGCGWKPAIIRVEYVERPVGQAQGAE